jgi:hypothetical protein
MSLERGRTTLAVCLLAHGVALHAQQIKDVKIPKILGRPPVARLKLDEIYYLTE